VRAGADAVKFQTFSADRLAGVSAPKAGYQKQTTDPGESQKDMLRRLELDEEAHARLAGHCRDAGILFLSTPFDAQSADLLERLGVPAFKTASGDLTDLPLLAHIARKGRPMIVSTGMADLDEVASAIATIGDQGCDDLVLLHCVSCYPADPGDVNLRAMHTLAERFDVPVGYSDHALGTDIAVAAAALGACILEKHFTLDRTSPGPDHHASLEPAEMARMIRGVRAASAALGDGEKLPRPSEAAARVTARKSVVATRALEPGHTLTAADLAVMRPASGIPPAARESLIGRTLARAVPEQSPIDWSDIEGGEQP
jgi:N,N'-diacetyllegionaminate synthase